MKLIIKFVVVILVISLSFVFLNPSLKKNDMLCLVYGHCKFKPLKDVSKNYEFKCLFQILLKILKDLF
jgi:hypothetical protein